MSSSLSQIIKEPTQYRGNDTPSVIDLTMVNDSDLLTPVDYLPTFGRSDHLVLQSCIQFTTSASVGYQIFSSLSRLISTG